MVEGDFVAEEQRLVGGHCFDHVDDERFVARPAYLFYQTFQSRHAYAARHRQQPAFHEILLVPAQDETGALLDQPAQEIVIGRGHCLSPQNRRVIFPAIRSSGRMAAQCPACATEPGIPQTTLVASSCASTLPPAATISPAPSVPSEPIPVRITARFHPPQTLAADAKSGSTAGLQKLIGGPLSIWATALPSMRATRRWRPPGAT